MKRLFALIKNEIHLKRNYLILVISALSFSFLLNALGGSYSLVKNNNLSVNQWSFIDVIFLFILMINSFILPNLLFRYLHQPDSNPFVSSLPFKKNQIFFGKYCAGIIIGYLPLVIYLFFIFIVGNKMGSFKNVFLLTTILFFFYYHLGCLASVLSGKTSFQIVLTLAFYFVPLFLYYAFMTLISNLVIGAVETELSMSVVRYIFLYYPGINNLITLSDFLWGGYILYAFLIIIMLIIALVINYFRKNEYSGEATINKWFTFIVKHIVILVVSLLLSSLYFIISKSDLVVNLLYLGIEMIVVSYITEMIFTGNKKAFSIYKTVIPLYIGVAVCTYCYTNFSTYYIPNEFKSLEITTTSYYYDDDLMTYMVDEQFYPLFLELHESLIEEATNGTTYEYQINYNEEIVGDIYQITFKYQLNNGSTTSRTYRIDESINEYFTLLVEDEEYIKSYYKRVEDLINDINDIEFIEVIIDDKLYSISEKEEKELLKTLTEIEIARDVTNKVNPLDYSSNIENGYRVNYYITKKGRDYSMMVYENSAFIRAIKQLGLEP